MEAAIIISVLLSFVEQLMTTGALETDPSSTTSDSETNQEIDGNSESKDVQIRRLLKRMRLQIWAGALAGFLLALAIGAAFIAVVSLGSYPLQRESLTASFTPPSTTFGPRPRRYGKGPFLWLPHSSSSSWAPHSSRWTSLESSGVSSLRLRSTKARLQCRARERGIRRLEVNAGRYSCSLSSL